MRQFTAQEFKLLPTVWSECDYGIPNEGKEVWKMKVKEYRAI